jgi:hypothetical protein
MPTALHVAARLALFSSAASPKKSPYVSQCVCKCVYVHIERKGARNDIHYKPDLYTNGITHAHNPYLFKDRQLLPALAVAASTAHAHTACVYDVEAVTLITLPRERIRIFDMRLNAHAYHTLGRAHKAEPA